MCNSLLLQCSGVMPTVDHPILHGRDPAACLGWARLGWAGWGLPRVHPGGDPGTARRPIPPISQRWQQPGPYICNISIMNDDMKTLDQAWCVDFDALPRACTGGFQAHLQWRPAGSTCHLCTRLMYKLPTSAAIQSSYIATYNIIYSPRALSLLLPHPRRRPGSTDELQQQQARHAAAAV